MENQKSPEPPDEKPDETPDATEEPTPGLPADFWSQRRWLARMSFSFLIVAVYLAYTGYQHAEFGHWRRILFYVGAMLAFVLFMMGTRERHRPQQ